MKKNFTSLILLLLFCVEEIKTINKQIYNYCLPKGADIKLKRSMKKIKKTVSLLAAVALLATAVYGFNALGNSTHFECDAPPGSICVPFDGVPMFVDPTSHTPGLAIMYAHAIMRPCQWYEYAPYSNMTSSCYEIVSPSAE
jgi:hypothetical protein